MKRFFSEIIFAFALVVPGLALFALTKEARANPVGMTVQSGSATISISGSQFTITAGNNVHLNWQHFNIGSGETTIFNQPSASSIAWNHVNDPNPSQIYGNIQANGVVVLLNSSGFYFGPGSFVSAAGLVVSTANCIPPQNAGGAWEFNGPPPLASIVNYGTIKVGNSGSAFLIADKVENHGNIIAPGGSIGFAAGQTVTLSERADGRGMSMAVKLPQGSVDNHGNIIADAGIVALHAKVVNQDGLIQANSVESRNGIIELVASDSLNLTANSKISASGDDFDDSSAAGKITLKSDNVFSDASGSQISLTGGSKGGDGGDVEVSAPNILSLNSAMDASAQAGSTAGQFTLNSQDLKLNSSGANGLNGSTLDLNVGTLANFSKVSLLASGDASLGYGNIAVSDGTSWDLGSGGQLTLNANGGISVGNNSQLIADGGTFRFYSKVLNQNGFIQANSVGTKHGIIELDASDSITLGVTSKIFANGDNSASASAGGQIMLQTEKVFSDNAASQIQFRGGANGGNGGRALIYAAQASVKSKLDGTANSGFTAGSQFYYPKFAVDLTLDASFLTPFLGFTRILSQTSGNITLSDKTVWDLSKSTRQADGLFTLEAGGNISLGSGVQILDANNWAVRLAAGYNFVNYLVTPGTASLLLNGNSFIQTSQGDISLSAAKDITVGSGYVVTKGGGDIDAHAFKGNIDTGSFGQGYHFVLNASSIETAYDLSGGLGGISTMAGGNLSLTAGGNISSFLPSSGGDSATAGAGAYGKQAGDVNIVAGRNVSGHYLVANGTGSIFAGVKMDASDNPIKDSSDKYVLGTTGSAGTQNLPANFALSLISGGWNVTAAQNIYLQEVRNPNGIFNITGAAAVKHLFDYAPGDFVNLSAGNQVQLGGTALPRPSVNDKLPMIFPSILNITAAGKDLVDTKGKVTSAITFVGNSTFNQLILYPSPLGSLVINTIGGGSLAGGLPTSAGAPQIFKLIVSDSAANQYKNSSSFGINDHADTPIHKGNSTPIQLNISGDMNLLALIAPEAAQINVVGNLNNCRFQGMNLSDGDTTSITVGITAKANMEHAGILDAATDGGLKVGGDINNRSAFTSVDLSTVDGSAAPILSYLARAVGGLPTGVTLANNFFYNPVTKVLTYQNISSASLSSILTSLQNLTVQKVDSLGRPLWADIDHTIPQTEVVSVMNVATAAALLKKYNDLGPIPDGTLGYAIGGDGKFKINARDMDLGTTPGIQSKGVGYYRNGSGYPLASFLTHGADIDISLAGSLTMYSSSIASLNGGKVTINADGSVSAGSSEFNVSATGARGIYSTSRGDVSVFAGGDINVNGSRIAAYDGGKVTVESFNGDINAGSGGLGYVVLTAYYVNPKTHQVYTDNPTIPGSGILATTFPPRDKNYPAPVAPIGNILVEAPNGKVNANQGGIVQLSFNGIYGVNSTVAVLAGYELRDSHGDRVTAANITEGTPVAVSDDHDIVASGSGVIAQNAVLKASGKIDGVIFARGNIDVSAVGNVNVTALAQGNVSVDSGGTISGTLIGVGGVSASGSSVDASLLSQNVSTSGDASGAKEGFAQGTAANSASQSASNEDTKVAKASESNEEDDLKKKKPVSISLAQRTSRVTVILPPAEAKSSKL